ncbi:MAG: DTW domain-containing protein YfiP [Bradymonadia bacterium]|jgi:DTW domain-containing protein YfiP
MHVERCICEALTPIESPTKLAVVMHRREVKKSTNTGHLALKCLSDSELFVRGYPEAPADLSTLENPGMTTLLLFPREDAVILTPEFVASLRRPLTLIVPDGTWAQARRMVKREAVMANAIAVLPPPGAKTEYQLRHEHVDGGLATAEAIARAFGALDGLGPQEHIERAFRLMVAGTLASRG